MRVWVCECVCGDGRGGICIHVHTPPQSPTWITSMSSSLFWFAFFTMFSSTVASLTSR